MIKKRKTQLGGLMKGLGGSHGPTEEGTAPLTAEEVKGGGTDEEDS
jgi:hypothetical protein